MSRSGLKARPLPRERPAAVVEPVLRQVADRQPRGLHDRARIRLVEARKHLEQRRLSGAVRAREPDAFTVVDLPADASSSTRSPKDLREGRAGSRCRVDAGVVQRMQAVECSGLPGCARRQRPAPLILARDVGPDRQPEHVRDPTICARSRFVSSRSDVAPGLCFSGFSTYHRGNPSMRPIFPVVALVTTAVLMPTAASAMDVAMVRLAILVQVSSRTSLTVSTDQLRFNSTPGSDSVRRRSGLFRRRPDSQRHRHRAHRSAPDDHCGRDYVQRRRRGHARGRSGDGWAVDGGALAREWLAARPCRLHVAGVDRRRVQRASALRSVRPVTVVNQGFAPICASSRATVTSATSREPYRPTRTR